MNFAHASFLLFGVWGVALTSSHVGFAAAMALGLVAAGALGLLGSARCCRGSTAAGMIRWRS
ncbi:hypothetical protein [Streptomyces asiaticus]|uniref:hypothetical protein n=1 Tax=Streptomyces asiaticus TaxID=114695 RepID=UPI003F66E822